MPVSRSGMDTPYVKNLALRSIEAGVLRVAYLDLGPSGGAGCDFVARISLRYPCL